MIELAARVWESSIEATIYRLKRENFSITTDHDEISHYVEKHLKVRKRMLQLWQIARENIYTTSHDVAVLLQNLQLKTPTEHPRWEQSCGQLVGCIHSHRVEEMIVPSGFIRRDGGSDWTKSTERAVFRGRNWKEVLVFPQFDLPGRIRSFLFVGRDADPEKDFVFRRCALENTGGPNWSERRCSGLFMHPEAPNVSGETIVAVDDPFIAYRLHNRHFLLSSKPLPLVAYLDKHPNRPRRSWEMLGTKQVLFWSPVDPIPAFRQAIPTNGLVSTTGPVTAAELQMDTYLARMSPVDLIARIRETSRPWPSAMAKHMEKLDDNQTEEMLSQLQMADIDLAAMTDRLPRQARERIQSMLARSKITRTVTMQNKQVVEKPGGWYIANNRGNDELIANMHLRIDYLIHHRRLDQTYYKGRVIWKGTTIPFVCPVPEFDRNPFAWIDKLLVRSGRGSLKYLKGWTSKAVMIAKQLQDPEVIFGADYIGYDREHKAFILPVCAIPAGGEAVDHDHGVTTGQLPGKTLSRPELISPQELDLIDHPTVWAGVISALANIIAPAFGHSSQGIGLLGAGADGLVKDVCVALGCLKGFVGRENIIVEELLDEEQKHGWPFVVRVHRNKKAFKEWLDPGIRTEGRNCVVRLDWYAFQVRKILGDWHLIHDPEPAEITTEAAESLQKLVPAYLADLMARNLQLAGEPEDGPWWHQVACDVLAFVRHRRGNQDALRAAWGLYSPSDDMDRADGFADLVGELVREGRFLMVPRGFEDPKKPCVGLIDSGYPKPGMYVPKQEFAEAVSKRGVALLSGSRITHALANAGVLLDNPDKGWVIDGEWWTERQHLRTMRESGMLAVKK